HRQADRRSRALREQLGVHRGRHRLLRTRYAGTLQELLVTRARRTVLYCASAPTARAVQGSLESDTRHRARLPRRTLGRIDGELCAVWGRPHPRLLRFGLSLVWSAARRCNGRALLLTCP